MKRFHVHMSVADLTESIRFYSQLFGVEPDVSKPDYAKWMLEDPRVNFAISTRRQAKGINHLGLQVDSDEELRRMQGQLIAADANMIQEHAQACCYARSDKYWITDPAGIAWETFHTLDNIPVYGEDTISTVPVQRSAVPTSSKVACCVPAVKPSSKAVVSQCCMPDESAN